MAPDALLPWLRQTRRHLHALPELSGQEFATSAYIRQVLTDLGVEVRDYPGPTGVVGLIRGQGPGPTIALRADIDALPLQELNEVPYRSQNEGVMHACGHDGHAAMVLGVARQIRLGGRLAGFKGNLKLLFQPAEESGLGAAQMVAQGVLEDPRVDMVLACHLSPDQPLGAVRIFRDLGYASNDRFRIKVRGRGCHGARPEEGSDPVAAAAYLITALQTIVARNLRPTEAGVITVGRVRAGQTYNVIPEEAELEGTVRALTTRARELLLARLQEMCAALGPMFRVQAGLELAEHMPSCCNDPKVAALLHRAAAAVAGPEAVSYVPPIMGSEDFAFFTQARPGALFRLGTAEPEKGPPRALHSPRFDFDERVLTLGVEVFLTALEEALGLRKA
ncbi:MAG: M20 family metallopeptidase [Thermodesulfobacteriota bacterium]